MRNDKVWKIALTALLLSLALIFSYIESLISLGFVFPGFRLGLSNITVLVVLYVFGEKYAVPFGLFKSFFSLLFLGRLSSLLFSVCGTAMSLIIMILLKKTGKFSIFAVSACGSVFHIWGQFFAAAAVFSSFSLLGMLPYLSLFAVFSGLAVAAVAFPVINRLLTK